MKIHINSNTLNSNKTVDIINKMVLDILFSNQPLIDVLEENKQPMQLYKNMIVLVTENR